MLTHLARGQYKDVKFPAMPSGRSWGRADDVVFVSPVATFFRSAFAQYS